MNKLKQFAKQWLLPIGVQDLIQKIRASGDSAINEDDLKAIRSNSRHKNKYSGRRCFILCNGESVATQDLTPLKDEIVFSVSQGYLLKQYEVIKPRFHCSPQFTYTELFTEKVAIEYLKEMEAMTGNAEIFLSTNEKKIVEANNIFSGRKVNYLNLGSQEQTWDQKDILDISKPVPGVQSVPIMCIMIAMYMGFSQIYLLGTDHDVVIKKKYSYPFKPKTLLNAISILDKDGDVKFDNFAMFNSYVDLWKQYLAMNRIARINNVEILNATAGGMLDVFPRVEFGQLFLSGFTKVEEVSN
jgi:hypothetical protein